ncbi:MAG: pantoate--beta-alanine ligase [Verrucomicrobiales bacterium]|jgi:pantoate--beta-alanine ligase
MRLIESIDEMMALIGPARVVLVPTMGALHDGHATLVREARSLAGKDGTVVVSIFVNPTQFAPGEDFESYPRNLAADRETCAKARADIIFHPSPDAMYAAGASIEIAETKLSQLLCGASRPTHFGGVCTVVAKLFNLVRPDIAVFGKKDYQQLAIIRRLVRDLNMGVNIHGVETVREEDGLAMSSRNLYLDDEQRAQAPVIRRALLAADTRLPRDEMLAAIVAQLHQEAPLGQIDYLELVDAETLERIERVGGRPALLAIAVFFGKTRLIDNLEAGPLE